jgi:hypothetical protein
MVPEPVWASLSSVQTGTSNNIIFTIVSYHWKTQFKHVWVVIQHLFLGTSRADDAFNKHSRHMFGNLFRFNLERLQNHEIIRTQKTTLQLTWSYLCFYLRIGQFSFQ